MLTYFGNFTISFGKMLLTFSFEKLCHINSEVMKEILSFNDKKAIGHDKIPASFLKIGRHVIAPNFNLFLQFIFNIGIYPNNCKIARVVPVYKNGDRTEMNNYRPISILFF